jgi:CubicO group peptidase (beta-lactamase class C family)
VSKDAVLDSTALRLQAIVANQQVGARMPTLVAGVVRDGALAWWTSRGSVVTRAGSEEPTLETQYRIGSITKTMTALLVMQLRDEGTLRLSDRLDDHLPGIAFGAATLHQLMSHSSGMQAEPPGPWWERSPGITFDELAARLTGTTAPFPASRQFHYSNIAFALLGEVVARKRGTTWAEALAARLLRPLEMHRTGYLPSAPAASGFSVHPFAGTLSDEPSQDTAAMAPAGQIWSTVGDLARYAAFLADPDPDIVSPDTLREMTVVQSGSPDDVVSGAYGLGFRLAVAVDRTYVGHTGSMPGFLAGLFVDRARRTGAVCLANGTEGLRTQALSLNLLRTLEELEPTLPRAWVPSADVEPPVLEILGLWHWGNTAFTLSYQEGELVSWLVDAGERWCTYRVEGADRYVGTSGYHDGETLQVVRRADGSTSHLECATFVFTRVPYDLDAPIPGGWPGPDRD